MTSENMGKKGFEICVPAESVISRKDFGSFELADTETGILFHVRGGYDVFVQPRMASLYQHLKYIIDNYDEAKDQKDVVAHDENGQPITSGDIFENVFTATITNMEIPLFMANSDLALFSIASKAAEWMNRLADDAMNAPLQPETPEKNGDFQRMVDALDEMEQGSGE